MRRVLLLILLSLVLAACAAVEAPAPDILSPGTFDLDEPFWIEMDAEMMQADGPLRLTFAEVTEDSRCPVGGSIQCAWAGQVVILLKTSFIEAAGAVSLTFPNSQLGVSSAVLFDTYTVQLLAVEPVRTSTDELDRSAYRVQLLVTEGLPTATPAPQTFEPGVPFWINMDDTLVETHGALEIFFLDVPEDSRCPVGGNINCEEAGRVTVRLQARLAGKESEAWMTIPDINQGVSRAEVFGSHTIELLAVEPQRTSLDRIPHADYRAHLMVTRIVVPTSEPPATLPPAPAGTFAPGEPFWIQRDQVMTLENGSLGVKFIDVTEDSRCPVNTAIQCFWAGQVVILVQAMLGPTTGQVSLTLPDSQLGVSRGGLFGLYTVELLAVEPEKSSTDEIDPSAYRAQLIVTEGVPESVTPMSVTVAPSITPAP